MNYQFNENEEFQRLSNSLHVPEYLPIVLSRDRCILGTTATGDEQARASSVLYPNFGVLGTNWAGEFVLIVPYLKREKKSEICIW